MKYILGRPNPDLSSPIMSIPLFNDFGNCATIMSESCENDSARRSLSPATVSERKIQKGNADSPNGQAAYGLCYVQADGASPNGKDSPIPTQPPRLRFMAHTTGVGRSAVQVKGPTLSSIDASGELA